MKATPTGMKQRSSRGSRAIGRLLADALKTLGIGFCVLTVFTAKVLLLLPTSGGRQEAQGWSTWPRGKERRDWFGW